MIDIFENTDRNGIPIDWACYGHVDQFEFRKDCKKIFDVDVITINHIYMCDKRRFEKDDDGNVLRVFNIFAPCNQTAKGAVKMTIGKL